MSNTEGTPPARWRVDEHFWLVTPEGEETNVDLEVASTRDAAEDERVRERILATLNEAESLRAELAEHQFVEWQATVDRDVALAEAEALRERLAEARKENALDMATRAAKTLLEIAECDIEEPYLGLTWVMNEAKEAIADMRSIEMDDIRREHRALTGAGAAPQGGAARWVSVDNSATGFDAPQGEAGRD